MEGASGTLHFDLLTLGLNVPGAGYATIPAINISGSGGGTGASGTAFLGVVGYTLTGTGTYTTSSSYRKCPYGFQSGLQAEQGTRRPPQRCPPRWSSPPVVGFHLQVVLAAASRAYNIGGSTDTAVIGIGGTGGDVPSLTSYTHTGTYTSASKPTAPTTICGNAISISAASRASTTVTITTSTAHGFRKRRHGNSFGSFR